MSSAVITARITEFLTASEISGQIGALVAPCAMPDGRVAEIAVREARDPVGVLLVGGAVEVQLLVEQLDGRRAAVAAEHDARGVAGQQLRAGEDHERGDEQRHDGAEQPPPDEAEQRRAPRGASQQVPRAVELTTAHGEPGVEEAVVADARRRRSA